MSKKSDKRAKSEAKDKAKTLKDSLLNETMVGKLLHKSPGLVTDRASGKDRDMPKTVLSEVRPHGAQRTPQQLSVLSQLFSRHAGRLANSTNFRRWSGSRKNRRAQALIGICLALGLSVGGIFAWNSESFASWLAPLKAWFQSDTAEESSFDEPEATRLKVPEASPPPASASEKAPSSKKFASPAQFKSKTQGKLKADGKAKVKGKAKAKAKDKIKAQAKTKAKTKAKAHQSKNPAKKK